MAKSWRRIAQSLGLNTGGVAMMHGKTKAEIGVRQKLFII